MTGSNNIKIILPKYVSKNVKNGRTFYRLRKYYNGKEIHIVQHPQLKYVLQCRTECEKVGWEKDKILELKQQFKENKPLRDSQYIYPDDKGGYRIAKWEKGRVRYYGKSHYYPEAVKIRDYLVEHGWKRPVLHKKSVSPNRYLTRTNKGRYRIQKEGKGYGTYDSYQEAIQMRNKLIENGWDSSIVQYRRGKNNPYRNIWTDNEGTFKVHKWVGDVLVHFGTYHTLEDAVCERDFWESINWDFDLLDLY